MANRLKPVATDIPELKRQKVNRSEQISRRGDKVRNVSVSLMDVDTTIMYYFNNVINPSVEDNGTRYKVPIRYASGERWNSIQNDGFFRTARGNVILPVIVFKRNSIQKDTNIPVDSMDNNALKYTFEKRYSDANRYSNFTAQYGIQPKREFYQVAVPDYQVLNYSCIIWTDYIEQMNGIVESITRSEGKYWGEPGKFKFRNQIESFDDATELDNEGERIVKTTFNMTFNGYLIPDSFDYEVLTNKQITQKKVVVSEGSQTFGVDELAGYNNTNK